jgi:hypothetical protein
MADINLQSPVWVPWPEPIAEIDFLFSFSSQAGLPRSSRGGSSCKRVETAPGKTVESDRFALLPIPKLAQ